MSDQIETQPVPNAQSPNQYATQPNAFRPGFSATGSPTPGLSGGMNGSGGFTVKPMVLIIALALMAAALVYQQTQLSRLSGELSRVNDNLKSSDVRDRLEAHEAKLQELNTRLTYLDSKISATDEKAQLALNKLKVQEDNDFFGNAIKSLKRTFGFQ